VDHDGQRRQQGQERGSDDDATCRLEALQLDEFLGKPKIKGTGAWLYRAAPFWDNCSLLFPMKGKKLVVAYCRVSTLEQKKNGLGLEIQIRDATLFAQAQGLFIDRFYRDEGESGILEDRPQLKLLLQQCRLHRVGTVIIPSLDRLSRDVRIAENLFWRFQRYGVRVLIADMPAYNGQDRRDVLIRQIREAIAEDNRKDIVERLLKGRQERVRKGHFPGGNIPYGYRIENKTLIPYAAEADVVREIIRLHRRGIAVAEIVNGLNRRWAKRRNGKPWTVRQVRAILSRRELYECGKVHYGNVEGQDERFILIRTNDA
jgi:site-specific DNA recombinase